MRQVIVIVSIRRGNNGVQQWGGETFFLAKKGSPLKSSYRVFLKRMFVSPDPMVAVAADLLRGNSPKNSLIRTSLRDVHKAFDDRDMSVMVHKFSKLECEESLQEHVKRHLVSTDMSSIQGPASDTTMIYKSLKHARPEFKDMDIKEAAKLLSD